jgi:hypothetical protein
MVFLNLCHAYLLEVGLMHISTNNDMLSIVCHVRIHVKVFIHDTFLGQLGLHLLCMQILTHFKINQQPWIFEVPWSPDFVLGLPPRDNVFENNPSDHETWSIRCHAGIPCKLHIHRAFTYSVGPSSVVWSELGPAPPFPPMRALELIWSWALSLVCEVALTIAVVFLA